MKVAYLLGSLNRGGTETLLLDVFSNADKASYEMIGIYRKDGAYRNDFYAERNAYLRRLNRMTIYPIQSKLLKAQLINFSPRLAVALLHLKNK